MDAPKMEVNCSVNNCQFNKNHKCHAENLEVNSMGDGVAYTSEGTACSTFVNEK